MKWSRPAPGDFVRCAGVSTESAETGGRPAAEPGRDIRAVIFDCDGTLVDSEALSLDVLREMALSLGIELAPAEVERRFKGVRMAEISAWFSARVADCPPAFETEFVRRFRERVAQRFETHLRPMPGAVELLSGLKLPFAIATNGPPEKAALSLRLTGLAEFIGNKVFSAYERGCFKPDPGLFLETADALGVPPAHCAVVEDSLSGLLAGIAAGMQVFALCRAEDLPEDVRSNVRLIGSLADLRAYL